RGFCAVFLREVAKKRVAGAKGKKTQRDAGRCSGMGEDAVEEFVSGAVAADGDKAAVALIVAFASQLGGVARSGGGDDVNVQAVFAQTRDGRAGELSGAAAACGGVDDGEEG